MKTVPIIWTLVNCSSATEADRIGRAALRQRLVSCYDIFARRKAAYFWPPHSGRIETARGALLALESINPQASAIRRLVERLHGDDLPFIGSLTIAVSPAYRRWVASELSLKHRGRRTRHPRKESSARRSSSARSTRG